MREFDMSNIDTAVSVTPPTIDTLFMTYRKVYDNGMVVDTTGTIPLSGLDAFSLTEVQEQFLGVMCKLREECDANYRKEMGWTDEPEDVKSKVD